MALRRNSIHLEWVHGGFQEHLELSPKKHRNADRCRPAPEEQQHRRGSPGISLTLSPLSNALSCGCQRLDLISLDFTIDGPSRSHAFLYCGS